MSVHFCCILSNWLRDGKKKLAKIYDIPENSVTLHCFPKTGQKQRPLDSYLRAAQRRSENLSSFAYVLWVSMLFSSYSYPCHWPLIPPSELSHSKLDHPPSDPAQSWERAVLHMTNLLLKTACVFLFTTAQETPCNPAFLWLVSTWVFYTSPYSSINGKF